MEEYQQKFSTITIIRDETNGLVKLDTIERHGQDRAIKIRNNFIGHLRKVNPNLLIEILQILNPKLPAPIPGEIIVGLNGSSIIMAAALAQLRNTDYNHGINLAFGDLSKVFSVTEDHRDKGKQYLYGVEPGDRVIIIEDEVTSGNGVIQLTTALESFGVTVVSIATVVETQNFDARQKIKAGAGIDLVSLVEIQLS